MKNLPINFIESEGAVEVKMSGEERIHREIERDTQRAIDMYKMMSPFFDKLMGL